MSLVASTIPNLVSGVSQQPSPSRLRTSGEQIINAYPSVVTGLAKRPPLAYRSLLSPTQTVGTDAAVHFIDRSPTERYFLVCGNSDLELYDVNGTPQTITYPNGKAYLPTSDATTKLRFVTVADTTFILNTETSVVAANITDTRTNPRRTASVFIKRAVASVNYAIYVNGALKASYTTRDNTTASTALQGTSEIASGLRSSLASNGYSSAVAVGTTVTFTLANDTDTVSVLDQYGGAAMLAYTDTVQTFEDLPPSEQEGRLLKVQGKIAADETSYWVTYSNGIWIEDVGYGAKRGFSASTMPHILVKTAANTFEFRENAWNPRTAGDADSNPDPTFVGRTINSMFLFKGRLGFLSEENVILSAVSVFEDIYLTTALQTLASDAIDVAAATGRVSTLRHAVPFADELLLFSDRTQFRLTSGTFLSGETVGITAAAAHPCSQIIPPYVVGSSAYFLADGATHAVARELFFLPDGSTLSGEDISVQIPAYIPKNIRNLTGSETSELLIALSGDEPNTVYIYKWYTTERRKVQSSWSKWTLGPDPIIGIGFFDQYLYVVYRNTNGTLRVERMAVGPVIEEPILLDHYVTENTVTSITYNAGTDTTTIVIGSGFSETLEFFRTDDASGNKYTSTKIDDTTYRFSGDITAHGFYGGINYEFLFEFTTQYMREQGTEGDSAIQDGRLQLRYFSVLYTDTSYFEASVTPTGGTERLSVFNGRTLSDPQNVADVIPRDTGEFKFPIFAKSEEVVIKLKNNQPFRCAFNSVEWSANYHQKARRVK